MEYDGVQAQILALLQQEARAPPAGGISTISPCASAALPSTL